MARLSTGKVLSQAARLRAQADADGLPPVELPAPRRGEVEVPAGAPGGTCRSCGADILWITTARGAQMPLSVATLEERDGQRFALSHFADCPQGKGWRK